MQNLIISYDLDKPGQNYAKVEAAIKALGSWARVNLSVWYVHTNYTMKEAYEKLKQAIDSNDRLLVVEAINAIAYNPIADWTFVRDNWNIAA